MSRVLSAMGAFVLACTLAACGSEPHPQALLAALGTAQALQHTSDEHEARGDLDLAITAAERVLDVPFPDGAEEREDVRLDAYGRIAELHLASNDAIRAESTARAGLAEATRDSYFRARLHVALGRIHQSSADRLRQQGDESAARTASQAALDELETSITINQTVLGLSGSHR